MESEQVRSEQMGSEQAGEVFGRFVAGAADAAALRCDDGVVTYRELRARIVDRSTSLQLPDRSLVALVAAPTREFVVTYLTLLLHGHVPLLVGDHHDRVVERWRPAALVHTDGDTIRVERLLRSDGSAAHAPLHPDLALLLSTSGSSGSPKLVRLSHTNLISNASSIVEYLGLQSDDVGITTLPLHYCYGLSVLHSHLLAGASVVMSDRSVLDDDFVPTLERHGVTNLAGVPYTFDLLDRVGAAIDVPSLRFLTQAGGRLEPQRVAAWEARSAERGVRFFVMYGATEATARMAYVPPDQLRDHPDCIGIPVPGGSIEVRHVEADGSLGPEVAAGDVGELVYRGPNVMLGYAEAPGDLSLGATLDELRTGDLARRLPEGLLQVVGRRSRIVKPFGLRVDLDDLEHRLREHPEVAWLDDVVVAGDDTRVVVGVADAITRVETGPGVDDLHVLRAVGADRLHELVRELTSLPGSTVDVVALATIPRTERGKVDRPAVLAASIEAADPRTSWLAARAWERAGAVRVPGADGAAVQVSGTDVSGPVADLFREVLGVDRVLPTDTFVSLGGDSLRYVECSIRLETILGTLPPEWHLRPLGSLAATATATTPATGSPRRGRRVDTTVALRAMGILAVVGAHMQLAGVRGGGHLLLAVAGYNLSRFVVDLEPLRRRWSSVLRSSARIALPTMAWVGAGMVFFGAYGWSTLFLVNDLFGPSEHVDGRWNFWFIEVLLQLTLLTAAALSIPFVRRWERRAPYGFVLALVALSSVFRLEPLQVGGWFNTIHRPHGAALVFLLGWLVHRSRTTSQRSVTTLVALVALAGYFQADPWRDVFVLSGVVLLVWWREVRVPGPIVRPMAVLAAASMAVYITHYSVYPVLMRHVPDLVAFAGTLAVGIGIWWVSRLALRAVRRGTRGSEPAGGVGESDPSQDRVLAGLRALGDARGR